MKNSLETARNVALSRGVDSDVIGLTRHVRTPEGSRRYHLPMGAPIVERQPASLLDKLAPPPGTKAIPAGHIRLYHQTAKRNVESIQSKGLLAGNAKYGDPRGLWAGTKPFYGEGYGPTGDRAMVEFHVPVDKLSDLAADTSAIRSGEEDPATAYRSSVVLLDNVPKENILGVYTGLEDSVRYMVENGLADQAIAGDFDHLGGTYKEAADWLRAHRTIL